MSELDGERRQFVLKTVQERVRFYNGQREWKCPRC